MNNVMSIIKRTFEVLKKSKITALPKAYEKEFIRQCKDDKDNEVLIELEQILKSLSPKELEIIKKNNITSVHEIIYVVLKRMKSTELTRFTNHLRIILSPSIDQSLKAEIDIIVNDISKKPELITKNSYINKITSLCNNRIKLDKNILNEKTLDVKKILALVGKYLDKSLIQSKNTKKEIYKIKDDLESLQLSDGSYRELVSLQSKLVETVSELENSMTKNQIELLQGQENFDELEEKITKLENDLFSLNKERNTDYLTGVLNRRAFQVEIEKIDNEYTIFSSNYAIVFYDLDYFKLINDKYGHDCGDTILRSFASLLQKLTRVDDIVSRYGGEEFVVLVHYKHEDEIAKYLKRVKSIISNNSFIYHDENVKVKFSAGVTFRKDYKSYEQTLLAADKFLYKAKFDGRDRIVVSSGAVY